MKNRPRSRSRMPYGPPFSADKRVSFQPEQNPTVLLLHISTISIFTSLRMRAERTERAEKISHARTFLPVSRSLTAVFAVCPDVFRGWYTTVQKGDGP